MPKPLSLPFDPIARADELWNQRWGSVPAMGAITSIMRAHQILLAEVDAVVKPYGLTFARYEALVLLTFSQAGELPMSKIGERLMVHPTSVTNAMDRLEAQGLVKRVADIEDRRRTFAELTAEGKDVLAQATEQIMAIDFAVRGLDAKQQDETYELLRNLRSSAGDFA